jgi:dolichol kinase
MRQQYNFRLELIRKLVHVLGGIFIVLLFQAGILTVPLAGLIILLMAAVVLYNFRAERELLTKLLSLNRADMRVPGLDILAYLLGCWLVLAIFPRNIAFAAILVLAFGDAVAHLVSKSFGATQTFVTRTTYLEGTIAAIVAATLAAWVYVPFIAALLASAVAMIVEAGELRIRDHYVDDNLVIPLVAGATLWVIQLVFPF